MSGIGIFVGLVAGALAAQAGTAVDRAAVMAELFWDQLTSVQAIERVTQAKLRPDGKPISRRTAEFDYVALVKWRRDGIAVEESRVPRSIAAAVETADPFLLTSGFPALLLMFHPDVRDKFEFWESSARDVPAGTVRLAFKSRPEERSMSALKLHDRLYPIQWRGFAWIDAGTGHVKRIEAKLAEPMVDLGLHELLAEVDYTPAAVGEAKGTYQLPSRVTVTVRTLKQQWRNVHEFSGYRLFMVTTSTRGSFEGDVR